MMGKSTAAKQTIFLLSFNVALGTDRHGLRKLATRSGKSQENSCHAIHGHRQKINPSFLGMLSHKPHIMHLTNHWVLFPFGWSWITFLEWWQQKKMVERRDVLPTQGRAQLISLNLFNVHASGYNYFRKPLNYSGISLDKVLYLIKDSFRLKGGNVLFLTEINT